ncbi:hypothetical protein ACMA1I_22610 [Pontibacter sp. 13R65]|uniref:hypothetical protein n=1 Tax=Pontibacter sp. 13R65 TaxID=3127458 RepID=UPI00301D70F9
MEIIVYLLLQLGILFGNPEVPQKSTKAVKSDQVQKMQINSMSTTPSNLDGGSGTWGDNG